MAKVSTSISLDAEVKERALPILNELGLDLSTLVGICLRQIIREERIPFAISLHKEPNAITRAAMEEVARGENLYGPFETVEDLMAALDAED